MADHKTLTESILEELKKTGYPTEIVSARNMQRRGWWVLHNPSYLDDIEGRSREFDIRAYRSKKSKLTNKDISVGFYLITECKRSEKPWVFFTTPDKHDSSRLGKTIKWKLSSTQVFSDASSSDSVVSDTWLRGNHHYFKQPALARTFYEPFKKYDNSTKQPQMIYSAVMSAIKATLFHLKGGGSEGLLQIYYPTIIFSGDLFEARIDNQEHIELLSSKYIQLSFNYIQATKQTISASRFVWENHHSFIVDIVHESYLETFLENIEAEQDELAEYLERG